MLTRGKLTDLLVVGPAAPIIVIIIDAPVPVVIVLISVCIRRATLD